MPIISAAIIPHSPILLPSIGKNVADKVSTTLNSIGDVSTHLAELGADTILIITNPDSKKPSDTLVIHTSEQYVATFEEFGDFATTLEMKCDTVLGLAIKRGFEERSVPVTFITQEKIDYSASVPMVLLKPTNTKILIIQPPEAPLKKLMEYGEILQTILQQSDKRIVVVSSGDLSHSLTPDAPLGLKLEGTVVDQDIITLFRSRKLPVRKIQSFSKEAALRSGVCGLNAFVMLAGVLRHMSFKTCFHSYEGPLGVGYCVISYTF